MYHVMTHIFRDKMTKVYQGTLEDCIDYVDEDTDIYFIMDENTDIYFLMDENSGLLSRMKERDGNEKLNEICEEIFKKDLTNY